MMSVRVGIRACSAWYCSMLSRRRLSAVRSAPVQRSNTWARLARNSSTAVHRLPTRTSTATNWPNMVASTSNTSRMAAWLAPPPIQEPATVVIPRQVSPAMVSGWITRIASKATRAPSMTPTVPVRNMMTAFGPSRTMALKSIATHSSTSELGRR